MSTVNIYLENNRKDTMANTNIHRDFSPGNPN
jgi:hypothetical protein